MCKAAVAGRSANLLQNWNQNAHILTRVQCGYETSSRPLDFKVNIATIVALCLFLARLGLRYF